MTTCLSLPTDLQHLELDPSIAPDRRARTYNLTGYSCLHTDKLSALNLFTMYKSFSQLEWMKLFCLFEQCKLLPWGGATCLTVVDLFSDLGVPASDFGVPTSESSKIRCIWVFQKEISDGLSIPALSESVCGRQVRRLDWVVGWYFLHFSHQAGVTWT